jgi:hypothetical protein
MRKVLLFCMVLVVFVLAGCSSFASNPTGAISSGLQVIDVRTTIGGPQAKTGTQDVSYKVTLLNPGPDKVTLVWVKPVVKDPVSQNILENDIRVMVNQTIAPNSQIVVSGTFSFDSRGFSKLEIPSLGSIFSGMMIASEQTLPLQSGKN